MLIEGELESEARLAVVRTENESESLHEARLVADVEKWDILISQMDTEDLAIYKLVIIFTSDQDMKSAFRNLVKAICSSFTFGDEYQPSTPLKVTSESRRIP